MNAPHSEKTPRRQDPKLSKLQVALYLLGRPSWYPDVWRRVQVNLARVLLPPPMGRSRAVAEAWAASQASSADKVLAELGGVQRRVADEFPEEMAAALRFEAQAPAQKGWGASVDLIFSACEAIGARNVVETGVAHGFSSLAILLSVGRRGGHLWSVDMPSPNLRDQRDVGIVVAEAQRRLWTLERSPDAVGLPRVLADAPALDLCHYDSDKAYEGRLLSYPRLWSRLRPGGVFMSDDIGDNTAFRDFAAEIGVVPMVVRAPGSGSSGERYVGLIRKPE